MVAISHTAGIPIDSRASISAIVMLAVLGPAMFLLQPGYVQGLVDYGGFAEEQAGLIAAAEMYGIAFTAILINLIINAVNWRVLALVFVLFSLAGNLLSLGQTEFDALRVVRFVTGLGSGGLISLTFTMMGHTARVDRNMGLIVAAVLTWGAIGLFSLPTVFTYSGLDGFMIILALFSAAGLIAIRYLPAFVPVERNDSSGRKRLPGILRGGLLVSVLVYNLAIGIVWVYMSLVGISAGLSEQTVANVMTVSQVLGIGGALIAFFLERRAGHMLPLQLSILGAAAGIVLLLGTPGLLLFALGVCLFNLLWNVTQPYVVAMLATHDDNNRLVGQGVALQMIGYALGPTIAATLLHVGGYDGVNRMAIFMFVAAALIMGVALYRTERSAG